MEKNHDSNNLTIVWNHDSSNLTVICCNDGLWVAVDFWDTACDFLRDVIDSEFRDEKEHDVYFSVGATPQDAIQSYWEQLEPSPEPEELLQRVVTQLSSLSNAFEELSKEVRQIREDNQGT